MAKDFSAIISDAQAKHRSSLAEQDAKQSALQEKSDTGFARATDFLNSRVVPLLEEARKQLAEKGYPLGIKRNWEGHGRPMVCSVTIQLEGPPKKNRNGGITTPKSVVYVFYHDGEKFTVGHGSSEHSSHADTKRPADELAAEQEVEKAIETVLTTYLAKIAEYRAQGMWD